MNKLLVIPQIVMIECDYCPRSFPSTKEGVTHKTIHMILIHAEMMTAEEIHRGLCFSFTKKESKN